MTRVLLQREAVASEVRKTIRWRRICTLCLILVAAAAISAADGNRTVLIDNFNDGDDDGWFRDDFTVGMPWGPATYDASSGAYLIQAADLVRVDDPNVGAIAAHWEASRGERRYSNGSVRAMIRANGPGTTIGVLMRLNLSMHTDYGFFGSTSFGTFYIERFDGGPDLSKPQPQTIIAMADPNTAPFAVGEDWHIEGGVVGDRLWLKAWKVGDPEPDAPLLSVKDKALRPDSGSEICLIVFFDPAAVEGKFVEISGTFDDVTFTHGK